MSRYEELADRLDAVVTDLDELSFVVLQDAVASGAQRRPEADKTLAQARRAAEKAARLMRELAEAERTS